MNRVLKVVLALAAAIAAFPSYSADRRVAFSPEGDFSEETIRRGVVATSEQCSKVSNAVWADTKEDGSEASCGNSRQKIRLADALRRRTPAP